MPKPSNSLSSTEIELKRRGRRRLIGAITLGLLAIVFLPMIFDPAPKRADGDRKAQEISIEIPPREGQSQLPAPKAIPAAPILAPAIAPTAVPETGPEPKSAPPVVETKKAAEVSPPRAAKAEPKAEPKVEPKAAPVAKAAPAANVSKTGFVVQLGAYADAENAQQLVARMKAAKLPVTTDKLPIKTGTVTRVRVGPYATREKADAALAEVKLAGGDGKIVPLK